MGPLLRDCPSRFSFVGWRLISMTRTNFFRHLYVQVLVAIILGALVGHFKPDWGIALKPLGDAFVKLVKMLIAPIIFTTVAVGMAGMGDLKRAGRVGLKAIIYFEIVTTAALIIGLAVVTIFQPGAGINAHFSKTNSREVEQFAASAESLNAVDFLLHIIPNTAVEAFAQGDILQVLLISILFGAALASMKGSGAAVVHFLDQASQALLRVIGMIMRVAPLAAFGAMAFTIGKFGAGTLISLGKLMACVYLTCFSFVFVVLGLILRWNGLGIWRFLKYLREEILIVLATSSSESVLPRMMAKMEALGCSKPVVGMVLPAGYSFNLDGTSIYLTIAAMFIAQATNVQLSLREELTMLLLLVVTSKGSAAVTGGGFITLAATLTSMHTIPVAGLMLIVGVDRFMSEARAITNLIGNGVGMVAVARWEKEFDDDRARRILSGQSAEEPAEV